MKNLENYPRLKVLMKSSSDLRYAFHTVYDLYKGKIRESGRSVAEHCLQAAEFTSYFTTNTDYLISAIYHDLREDLSLSFNDIKKISGANGQKIARIVTILSKRPDIQNREERNHEYLSRLSNAILIGDREIGIVKLSDRLSNLKDLDSLRSDRRKAIARQTLSFFVPLSLKLGFFHLAHQLTVLSVPHTLQGSDRSIIPHAKKEPLSVNGREPSKGRSINCKNLEGRFQLMYRASEKVTMAQVVKPGP